MRAIPVRPAPLPPLLVPLFLSTLSIAAPAAAQLSMATNIPTLPATNPNFGKPSSLVDPGRRLQFGLRFGF